MSVDSEHTAAAGAVPADSIIAGRVVQVLSDNGFLTNFTPLLISCRSYYNDAMLWRAAIEQRRCFDSLRVASRCNPARLSFLLSIIRDTQREQLLIAPAQRGDNLSTRRSALFSCAFAAGNEECCKLLLFTVSQNPCVQLRAACRFGWTDIARKALHDGADFVTSFPALTDHEPGGPGYEHRVCKTEAILIAAHEQQRSGQEEGAGGPDLASLLRDDDLRISMGAPDIETIPLLLAVRYQHVEILELLAEIVDPAEVILPALATGIRGWFEGLQLLLKHAGPTRQEVVAAAILHAAVWNQHSFLRRAVEEGLPVWRYAKMSGSCMADRAIGPQPGAIETALPELYKGKFHLLTELEERARADDNITTPIRAAAARGHKESVKIFAACTDQIDRTEALICCCMAGLKDEAQEALQQGGLLHSRLQFLQHTPPERLEGGFAHGPTALLPYWIVAGDQDGYSIFNYGLSKAMAQLPLAVNALEATLISQDEAMVQWLMPLALGIKPDVVDASAHSKLKPLAPLGPAHAGGIVDNGKLPLTPPCKDLARPPKGAVCTLLDIAAAADNPAAVTLHLQTVASFSIDVAVAAGHVSTLKALISAGVRPAEHSQALVGAVSHHEVTKSTEMLQVLSGLMWTPDAVFEATLWAIERGRLDAAKVLLGPVQRMRLLPRRRGQLLMALIRGATDAVRTNIGDETGLPPCTCKPVHAHAVRTCGVVPAFRDMAYQERMWNQRQPVATTDVWGNPTLLLLQYDLPAVLPDEQRLKLLQGLAKNCVQHSKHELALQEARNRVSFKLRDSAARRAQLALAAHRRSCMDAVAAVLVDQLLDHKTATESVQVANLLSDLLESGLTRASTVLLHHHPVMSFSKWASTARKDKHAGKWLESLLVWALKSEDSDLIVLLHGQIAAGHSDHLAAQRQGSTTAHTKSRGDKSDDDDALPPLVPVHGVHSSSSSAASSARRGESGARVGREEDSDEDDLPPLVPVDPAPQLTLVSAAEESISSMGVEPVHFSAASTRAVLPAEDTVWMVTGSGDYGYKEDKRMKHVEVSDGARAGSSLSSVPQKSVQGILVSIEGISPYVRFNKTAEEIRWEDKQDGFYGQGSVEVRTDSAEGSLLGAPRVCPEWRFDVRQPFPFTAGNVLMALVSHDHPQGLQRAFKLLAWSPSLKTSFNKSPMRTAFANGAYACAQAFVDAGGIEECSSGDTMHTIAQLARGFFKLAYSGTLTQWCREKKGRLDIKYDPSIPVDERIPAEAEALASSVLRRVAQSDVLIAEAKQGMMDSGKVVTAKDEEESTKASKRWFLSQREVLCDLLFLYCALGWVEDFRLTRGQMRRVNEPHYNDAAGICVHVAVTYGRSSCLSVLLRSIVLKRLSSAGVMKNKSIVALAVKQDSFGCFKALYEATADKIPRPLALILLKAAVESGSGRIVEFICHRIKVSQQEATRVVSELSDPGASEGVLALIKAVKGVPIDGAHILCHLISPVCQRAMRALLAQSPTLFRPAPSCFDYDDQTAELHATEGHPDSDSDSDEDNPTARDAPAVTAEKKSHDRLLRRSWLCLPGSIEALVHAGKLLIERNSEECNASLAVIAARIRVLADEFGAKKPALVAPTNDGAQSLAELGWAEPAYPLPLEALWTWRGARYFYVAMMKFANKAGSSKSRNPAALMLVFHALGAMGYRSLILGLTLLVNPLPLRQCLQAGVDPRFQFSSKLAFIHFLSLAENKLYGLRSGSGADISSPPGSRLWGKSIRPFQLTLLKTVNSRNSIDVIQHCIAFADLRQGIDFLRPEGDRSAPVVESLPCPVTRFVCMASSASRFDQYWLLAQVVDKGDAVALELLLQNGADMHAPIHDRGRSALTWLCCRTVSHAQLPLLRLILATEDDPLKPDVTGLTPVQAAVLCGNDTAGGIVLQHPSVPLPDALVGAARLSLVHLVRQLLHERGANPNSRSQFALVRHPMQHDPAKAYYLGDTPWDSSSWTPYVRDGLAALRTQAAQQPAQAPPVQYGGALHALKDSDDGVEIARLLLEAGADVNLLDEHGRTPLQVAKARKQSQLISFFEANGAKAEGPSGPRPGEAGSGPHGTFHSFTSMMRMLAVGDPSLRASRWWEPQYFSAAHGLLEEGLRAPPAEGDDALQGHAARGLRRGGRRNSRDEGEDRQEEEDHDDEDDHDDGDEDDEQDGGPEGMAAGVQRAADLMHNMFAGERGVEFAAMAMRAMFGDVVIPAHGGGYGQEGEGDDDEDEEEASVD